MKSLVLFFTFTALSVATSSSPLADIGKAPGFELTDAENKPFAWKNLNEKVVLVGFVYTTCNGTCPLTSANMAKVRDRLKKEGLWGERVEFVSISLDPEHDTPKALKTYSRIYEADASWHFLTGSKPEVDRVITAWGMWAKRDATGMLDHPSRIFLVDPKGREREIYSLSTLEPETVLEDVRGLLSERAN